MRLILLSVLTYGCGDEAKFFQATGKVKEKKAAKVQAVEPAPELTSEPQIEPKPEEKTESEFCPDSCGDISVDDEFCFKYYEQKNFPLAKKFYPYWWRKYHRCANALTECGDPTRGEKFVRFWKNTYKSLENFTLEDSPANHNPPRMMCFTYYFQKLKLKELLNFYKKYCDQPCP